MPFAFFFLCLFVILICFFINILINNIFLFCFVCRALLNGDFFCYFVCFYFLNRIFLLVYNFFFTGKLYLKIKLLPYIIYNMFSIALYFFSLLFYSVNLTCMSIFIIVQLNKKIILIKKFRKYDRVNILFYEVKYLDLCMSLDCFHFYF
jgi:hypothetical protein